jgi:hypothetical protein
MLTDDGGMVSTFRISTDSRYLMTCAMIIA